MKTKYKAILFHPNGDHVTDFPRNSKQEIWDEIADMGSRWIFYPLVFIATDTTIVDACDGMEQFKGKRISTLQKYLQDIWEEKADEICDVINHDMPLELVY